MRGDRARARPRPAARADAADPVRRARRVPRRPHAVAPDAPPAAAVGRRRVRVGLRRAGARLGAGLGVGRRRRPRRAEQKCARAALPGGRQRRPQRRPAQRQATRSPTDYAAYSNARQDIDRACRAPTPAARSARCALPGPGGARQLAFANATVVDGRRRQQRRHATASTRSTATASAAPAPTSRSCPRSTRMKYSLSHFDNSRHLVRGQLRTSTTRRAGWAAGSTATAAPTTRCRRSRSTPRSRSRSARRQAGVRDQLAADERLQVDRQPAAAGAQRGDAADVNDEVRTLAGVAAGAGNDYLDRSRTTYGLAYATAQPARRRRTLPPTTPATRTAQHALPRGCAPPRTCSSQPGTRVITIHWGGFDTHTNQLAEPGHAAQGALARARRVPERPREPRIDHRVVHARVLGVRPAREGDAGRDRRRTRAPTTARAA